MDIIIERKGADYLVKAEVGRQRLLDEGFSIWGTQQFDSMNGLYFRVSHPSIHEMKVTPFKDMTLHKKPIDRERW
jgi:hypothetical protein